MLRLILSYFLILFLTETTANTSISPSKWDGWKVNASAGVFGVLHQLHSNEIKRAGPCFEAGMEYGKAFGSHQQFYVGGSILFNAFIPDSFQLTNITFFGEGQKLYPIFFPLFDILFGYNTTNSQFIIGSTYLWGLTFGYRHFLTNNIYLSAKCVWWMDRVLFDRGLHDGYATIGIGYCF